MLLCFSVLFFGYTAVVMTLLFSIFGAYLHELEILEFVSFYPHA
jgi:hypothetical protein